MSLGLVLPSSNVITIVLVSSAYDVAALLHGFIPTPEEPIREAPPKRPALLLATDGIELYKVYCSKGTGLDSHIGLIYAICSF